MTTRWLAFVVSAAVAVGAGVWALRASAPADSAPSRANTVDPAVPTGGDRTRVVGAAAPMVAPATTGDRFKLVGVVPPRESVAGSPWVALIAVDDEPARAFIVGATVKGDIVLREVSTRGAILGPREGSVKIGLEVSPAPATGTAPMPMADSGHASQVPTGSSVESRDLPPSLRSKYLPQTYSPPANPIELTPEVEDGRWRRPSAP